ncbi:MAG: D-alanyl-D-alanine carboxypeptidase [Limnobacter sp.]|nr:D-alanyl-D-alanine carboxypeptidase [Limnobacter sp.]
MTRISHRISRVATSTALGLGLLASAAPTHASNMVPAPEIGAKGYILVDITTNQTLAKFNSQERLEPASLTKLMTAYLVFDALESKQISMDQKVPVSTNAWKAEGSRMFIEPGKEVTVDQLLHGMIVQSGNDATRALAELLAGDEANFAALMNQQAKRLGLTGTNFENSTGLPGPQHYTTADDLATLASAIIKRFPEYYRLYSEKEYTYNGIRQPNRNRLLWIDPSVDGMKTGHTDSAGYCLVSSAKRTLPIGLERRLLSVVLGTQSDQARTQESLKLLNYGFQMYETVKLYDAKQAVATSQVYKGSEKEVPMGVTEPLLVNVPRGMSKQLEATVQRKDHLIAPIAAGTELGTLKLTLEGKTILEKPLLALKGIEEAGIVGRLIDSAKLWWKDEE